MRRRDSLIAMAAAALAGVAPAVAQTGTAARRIGILMSSHEALAGPAVQSFISGLADHGYVAGKNLTIDVRFADGDLGRLPALAAQLIALKPDVLAGIEAPALAFRAHTKTIPIVLIAGGNPVTSGLVQSLARPGTNVTGTSLMLDELTGKHVELLAEMVPKMTRVALLYYDAPSGDGLAALARQAEASARAVATAKRLTLTPAGAHDATSLQRAFGQIESARAQGVVYVAAGGLLPLRDAILRTACACVCPRSARRWAGPMPAACSPTAPIFPTPIATPPNSPHAFSRAPGPPTCRWNKPASSRWRSIEKPRARSACRCPGR